MSIRDRITDIEAQVRREHGDDVPAWAAERIAAKRAAFDEDVFYEEVEKVLRERGITTDGLNKLVNDYLGESL